MLSNLNTQNQQSPFDSPQVSPSPTSKYCRNEEEDMKKAIGYLYDFKKKLDELHPGCVVLIENMLQKNYRF